MATVRLTEDQRFFQSKEKLYFDSVGEMINVLDDIEQSVFELIDMYYRGDTENIDTRFLIMYSGILLERTAMYEAYRTDQNPIYNPINSR